MDKKRKNFILTESTMRMLGDIKNASAYIDRKLSDGWSRANLALQTLNEAGWSKEEILCAVESLNGSWLTAKDLSFHASTMLQSRRFDMWDIKPSRWEILAGMVADNDKIAFAIDTITAEYWAGNTIFKKKLKDG